jgi:hypothetical protein
MNLNKVDIDRVRRKAYRNGFQILKSRERSTHSNNRGGLMLVEIRSNTVLEGVDFDLDATAAEHWIDRYAAEGRGERKGAR